MLEEEEEEGTARFAARGFETEKSELRAAEEAGGGGGGGGMGGKVEVVCGRER